MHIGGQRGARPRTPHGQRPHHEWYGGLVPQTALTPAIRDEIARLGQADIMVGIPSFKNAATIGYVVRAAQAGLVQYFPDLHPVVVNSDAGSPDGTGRVVIETEPPDYVEQILLVRPEPAPRAGQPDLPRDRRRRRQGRRPAHDLRDRRGARGRRRSSSSTRDLRCIVPEWIELLAGPILKGGYDFVAPLYARYKYDGTITNTVTYPLTRALYGHRIRQPIGGDFGVSGDLVRHYLELDDWTPDISKFGIDIWMTTSALAGGFAVCQTRLGAKIHDPKDPGSDLGPMFRQVVGTILRLADRYADHWLPIRGSHDVPAYGFERIIDPPPLEVNTLRLLSEFHAGLADPRRHVAAHARPGHRRDRADLAAEAGTLADAGAVQARASAGTWRRRRPPRSRWPRPSARSTSPTTCGRASSTTWSSPRAPDRGPGRGRRRRDDGRRARADLLRARRQLRHREPHRSRPTPPRTASSARRASSSCSSRTSSSAGRRPAPQRPATTASATR